MFNHQSLRQNSISSYKPSFSLPNQFNDYIGNEISLRRNLINLNGENISNISFGENSKKRNEYSHSPFCILHSENKFSSPTLMNIRMNFDLLNHKIERLNNLLTESNSNISNSLNKQNLRPNSTNKFYNSLNLKSPDYYNTVTTNVSVDNFSKHFNNNSPFQSSYSLRYNTTTNRNNELSTNDLNDYNYDNLSINNSSKNINNNSIYNKENLSVNSINNLLTPPKNKNIDNYTYKNRKFTNYLNKNNGIKNTIKINIQTRNDIKNEKPESNKTKAKLLTKSDITEMINNLHEKTKSFSNYHQNGMDRYKRFRINKKMNNFKNGVISGNLFNIKNSFDIRTNRAIDYIRNYLNNKEIPFKYNNQSPIKNIQINYNNSNYLNDNNNNINKNNFCTNSTCKKCRRKQPEKKIYSYGNNYEFDKKIKDILSFQKNNKPIQIRDNITYQKKIPNYKKKNYNIKDLIKEFKEKKNEKNTLNIDKAIDNFGGLVNIENGIKDNYFEQNKMIKKNFKPKREDVEKIFEEIKNNNQGY